jgi:chromosomal replication initiator protein
MTTDNTPLHGNGSAAGSPLSYVHLWPRVVDSMRKEFGDSVYNSWVKPLAALTADATRVVLSAPTRFMSDWVQSHYLGRLSDYWQAEIGHSVSVEVMVNPLAAKTSAAEMDAGATQPSSSANRQPGSSANSMAAPAVRPASPAISRSVSPSPDDLCAPIDDRYTFDSFVVGKSNELAHAAARRVASSESVQFNPLFLYGGVGLGKTHLMHALAREIRMRNPERKVLYLSAEKFMYQFVRALRFKDTMAFKEQFRSVDVLMVDDVQFIAHKDATQEEFFHTFNALVDHNRQVIISADRSPSDLEGIEERIRSRLGWGLVADIHPTDYELRLGILQSKLEQMGGVDVADDVLEFLAHKITSNVRELEGALNRVSAHASLMGKPVTLEVTRDVLQDLIRANDRRVTIDEIQRHVADYFHVRLADLLSARRARAVARPRQVAMYLSKQLTARSLPEIGRKFGGRDHTTVMHAVKRIDELREIDSALDDDLQHLNRVLGS